MAAFYHALFVVGADAAGCDERRLRLSSLRAHISDVTCLSMAPVVTLRPDEEFDFHLDAHV
jgi:hypothetical protein